ncbi:MAG: hypothetical protein IJZ29_04365 [Clostridia bacterium]|nr:hypothetical protein [Clostridia bacterium]
MLNLCAILTPEYSFILSLIIIGVLFLIFLVVRSIYKMTKSDKSLSKDLDYGEITLFEKVESAQAFKLFREKSNKYYGICNIAFVVAILIFALINPFMLLIPVFIYAMALLVISNIVAPYRELYETALKNDKIRHEERIRFKERKRLSSLEIPPKPPTLNQIKTSFENSDEANGNSNSRKT